MNFFQFENKIIQNKQKDITDYYKAVPPGIYKPGDVGGPNQTIFSFEPISFSDRLVEFREGPMGNMMKILLSFFNKDTIAGYEEMGMTHKMGLIIHGEPGTGKTVTSRMLMERIVKEYNAVGLIVTGYSPYWVSRIIKFLRTIQSSPVVCFYDEFELLCNEHEESLLTFLDGEDSIGTCITIACTNHLDKIPERIKNRKSRIKHLIEIKSLPHSVYKQFIIEKLPSLPGELQDELAYKAVENSLTLDQVKHVLIDYRIEKQPFDSSIDELKAVPK